ncbi:MAG: HAMP domain-containing histidine kinase [Anaerolineales bacterium]|nr:HAMP domain-containing histidine kinase [Anaerolineales bacterium]
MLRTLRSRLILSHILPLIVIVPLIYIALVYLLETRFLLPRLTQELLDNARLLTEVTRAQRLTPQGLREFQLVLLRLPLNPSLRVVYLETDGTILYSNDPDYLALTGQKLDLPELERARSGEEVTSTSYSFLPGRRYSIQALLPVPGANREIVAILWMTYYEASISKLFQQMRSLSVLVMLGSLLVGAFLGSALALNISNPVRQATRAINSLARGESSGTLVEQGAEEVRELIRAVNVLVTRLQSLEQARRQLLANLVHELGRPLGALRSAIQALARGAGNDPQLLSDLTAGMDEEAARLQNILEELAHLHDQVLGSLELHREAVALSEWLPRVLLPWAEAAADKRLEWRTDIPPDMPVVQVDRVRFAQVIGNLVSNAVKYTPAGGAVDVLAGEENGVVWMRVHDNGPGIPQAEHEKIFQAFYRGAQGKRIKQGMGLGLSIARDLAVAHGGRVEVESAPNSGSTFTIWLPLENDLI